MLYYMQKLQEQLDVGADRIASPPRLVTSVSSWWARELVRKKSYRFSEIKAAIGCCQDSELSAALVQLGWVKRRKWATTGANLRAWVPPCAATI